MKKQLFYLLTALAVLSFVFVACGDDKEPPVTVTGVTLSPRTLRLTEGDTETLVATVAPPNATNPTVTWSSSSTATATVANGLVTAIAEGAASITVTTADGSFTDTCVVTVEAASIAVTDVALDLTSGTLTTGDTLTLAATVTPPNATNPTVMWSSSSTATATVVNGLITAVAEGAATITVATADGGHTATFTLSVTDKVIVNGVEWATVNVDDYQTFAASPDMYTKFYRWNSNVAWAAEGSTVSGWSADAITDPEWTVNPCPSGWRLPTSDEWTALNNTGSTWAAADARGNAVNGRFFGPNHAACSLPSGAGCIFLPAGGYRDLNTGTLYNRPSYGYYWLSTQDADNTNYGYSGSLWGDETNLYRGNKKSGFSVRCVNDEN